MKTYSKYISNILTIMLCSSIVILSPIVSGCTFFNKDASKAPLSQTAQESAEKEKKDKPPIVPQKDVTTEDLITSDDNPAGGDVEQEDFSTAAYYYYMKSERERQNGDIISAIDSIKQAISTDPDSIYLKKNLILLHILNKDNTGAAEVAQEMYSKNPDNEDILIVLAKLKLQLNQIKEAETLYQQLIKINPENHDAYVLLGNIYMNNQQNDRAFSLFSQMVQRFPESYGAHFFLGKLYAEKKNFVQAEKEFIKSIELRSELVEPRFELITIYKAWQKSKSGRKGQKIYRDKVLSLYQEILKLDDNNIKAAIELPLYMYKNGEKSKASKILAEFGQRYQQDDNMMVAMAKELINNDNKNDAVIVFTELLKESPDELAGSYDKSALHYLAGLTFDSLKESKMAIEHLMKVSPKSDQYKKSVLHIAYVYSQLGQNRNAIHFLESKLGEFSQESDIISYLSAFYEEEKELDKADSLLQQGLKISPDDTELLFRSGVILDKKGDKEGSMSAMKRVIKLDPKHASALNYLGYTYAELGINLDEAEELIKRSLAAKPDDGYITDSLGWVYYKKGQYDKAVEVLERAVIMSSGDPVILEHLGDAYKAKKMYSKAIEAYKKALNANKDIANRAVIEKKIDEIAEHKQ